MNAITPIDDRAHPAATSASASFALRQAQDFRTSGDASLAPLPQAGGVGGGHERYTIFSPQSQSKFLEHLSTNGNVRLACRAAGVSPQTAYRARRKSPQLAALWDAALLSARQHAADVLAERALNGVEEKVFYHGEEVATRTRYSDRLLLAHLARLDKLEERADIAANLAVLDEAIAGLAQGEELENSPFVLRQAQHERGGVKDTAHSEPVEGQAVSKGEQEFSDMDPVPSVPSCRNSPVEECPDCGGKCEDPDAELTEADCMWLGNRLDRMDAARPEGVQLPHQLASRSEEVDEIEWQQLLAFEAGEEEWWLIVPTAQEWAEIEALGQD